MLPCGGAAISPSWLTDSDTRLYSAWEGWVSGCEWRCWCTSRELFVHAGWAV